MKNLKKLMGVILTAAILLSICAAPVAFAEDEYDYDVTKNILFGMTLSSSTVALTPSPKNVSAVRQQLVNGKTVSDTGTEAGAVWLAAAGETDKTAFFILPAAKTADTITVTYGANYDSSTGCPSDLSVRYYDAAEGAWKDTTAIERTNKAPTMTQSFKAVSSAKYIINFGRGEIRIREISLSFEDVEAVVTPAEETNVFSGLSAKEMSSAVFSPSTATSAILTDGNISAKKGTPYWDASAAADTSYITYDMGKNTMLTHIALYSGKGSHNFCDHGIEPEKVKVYYKNTDNMSDWAAAESSGVSTSVQTDYTNPNKAKSITYFSFAPFKAREVKIEIKDTDFILFEAEAYYSVSNKLFGKRASRAVPEAFNGDEMTVYSEFGSTTDYITVPGFVFTDGISDNPNGMGKWYVKALPEGLNTPYVDFEAGGAEFDSLKIFSGSTETADCVDPYSVRVAYSSDALNWDEVKLNSVSILTDAGKDNNSVMTVRFGKIAPNYLRVYLNGNKKGIFRLKEIEAYLSEEAAPAEEAISLDYARTADGEITNMQENVPVSGSMTLKFNATPTFVNFNGTETAFTASEGDRTKVTVDISGLEYDKWYSITVDCEENPVLKFKTQPQISVSDVSISEGSFSANLTNNSGIAADAKIYVAGKTGDNILTAVASENSSLSGNVSINIGSAHNYEVYLLENSSIRPMIDKIGIFEKSETVLRVTDSGFYVYVKNSDAADGKYIGYEFTHITDENNNSDLYRMTGTAVYKRDGIDSFKSVYGEKITGEGGYELAVQEKAEGSDFIGGFFGNEKMTGAVSLKVDENPVDMKKGGIYKGTAITFEQTTTVYSGQDSEKPLYDCARTYNIGASGVELLQNVTWLAETAVKEVNMATLPANRRQGTMQMTDTVTIDGLSFYRPCSIERKINPYYATVPQITVSGGDIGANISLSTELTNAEEVGNTLIQSYFYEEEAWNFPCIRLLKTTGSVANEYTVSAGETWQIKNKYDVRVK